MLREIKIPVEEFDNETFLNDADKLLLEKARQSTADAYAPYSGFRVAAAGKLMDGTIVTGTNQENASYPVGICAERTLLSAISAMYPNNKIETIAITYDNPGGDSSNPVAPCGICRQTLAEYEIRNQGPIRLILAGSTGKIILLEKASSLLPLSFSADDMKR
ncbi:MAG: cytidine deaminase [Bacteroidota bacterium]